MADKKDVARPSKTSSSAMIDTFLGEARRLAPVPESDARPRLVFALDATMSRQPTWDLACKLQGDMFNATADVGGLNVQLVYFRGFDECRASRWVAEPRALRDLMTRIDCRGGHTQIERVLRHVAKETARLPVKALIYVGDAMEEPIDDICAAAGELGLRGVKAFMFQEGRDPVAMNAFREVSRLTNGAYARFDAGAPGVLADLLKAAAVYATGGMAGLTRLAERNCEARRLLTSMTGPSE